DCDCDFDCYRHAIYHEYQAQIQSKVIKSCFIQSYERLWYFDTAMGDGCYDDINVKIYTQFINLSVA
ncbi:45366_t:CDS:2, partial [Gigaspora margarita]